MTPAQARDWHNRKAGILDIKPRPVHETVDRSVPGPEIDVPVRIYTPRASTAPLPVLVWLHGGGHVVGSLDSYDALCRQFALSADCIVVSVALSPGAGAQVSRRRARLLRSPAMGGAHRA